MYLLSLLLSALLLTHRQIIKLLIKNGANINSVNNENQTPKDLAKENVHDDVFEYLEQFENR